MQQWYVALHAGVAQSVEQRTRNAKVAGSIPVSGTTSGSSEGYQNLWNHRKTRLLAATLFTQNSLAAHSVTPGITRSL